MCGHAETLPLSFINGVSFSIIQRFQLKLGHLNATDTLLSLYNPGPYEKYQTLLIHHKNMQVRSTGRTVSLISSREGISKQGN